MTLTNKILFVFVIIFFKKVLKKRLTNFLFILKYIFIVSYKNCDIFWPLRLAVRTTPFHGVNTSSILVGVIFNQKNLKINYNYAVTYKKFVIIDYK